MNAQHKPLLRTESNRNHVIMRDTVIGIRDMSGKIGLDVWCWKVKILMPPPRMLRLEGLPDSICEGLDGPMQVRLRFPRAFLAETRDGQAANTILSMLHRNDKIPGWDTESRIPGGCRLQAKLFLTSGDRRLSLPVVVDDIQHSLLWRDVHMTALADGLTWM